MNTASTKWFSPFWKSLFTWRNTRRALVGAAIVATLLAMFYAEENWRGRRAWDQCKRELEAKGANFDWSAYLPAPIPDEQNVFQSPKMTEWFVRKSWTENLGREPSELSTRLGTSPPAEFMRRSNAVAEVTVIVQREFQAAPPADLLLDYSGNVLALATSNAVSRNSENSAVANNKSGSSVSIQEAAKERLMTVFQDALDHSVPGKASVNLSDIRRRKFVTGTLPEIKTVRLTVFADRVPKDAEVRGFLPLHLDLNGRSGWRVVTTGSNSFNLCFADESVYSAAEYLTWSDQFEPEFATIREGLRRPHAQIVGDAQRPFAQPIPDFVCIRNLAQLLAERAQCQLVLGRPELALKELTLLYDLRRLLSGKPTLLVAAMIDVAISGLYVTIVADGVALHAWREPELIALQKQLAEINLPSTVLASLRTDNAATCHTLLHLKSAEIIELFRYGEGKTNPWKKFTDPTYLLIKFAPRGWVYQNLVSVANAGQAAHFGIFDPKTGLVYPGRIAEGNRIVESTVKSRSPYSILARVALPNFSKAMQSTARSQTFVNEAFIVCTLERYRMARGEYPDSLSVLVPTFADAIPSDLIGGRPLGYQRTRDGKFLLYSVGWNETDDGGEIVRTADKEPRVDIAKGDWVWPPPIK